MREARAALGSLNVPVWSGQVTQRNCYSLALAEGQGASEFDGRSEAASEIAALWTAIEKSVQAIHGERRQGPALPGRPSVARERIALHGLRHHDDRVAIAGIAPEPVVDVTDRALERRRRSHPLAGRDPAVEGESIGRPAQCDLA